MGSTIALSWKRSIKSAFKDKNKSILILVFGEASDADLKGHQRRCKVCANGSKYINNNTEVLKYNQSTSYQQTKLPTSYTSS